MIETLAAFLEVDDALNPYFHFQNVFAAEGTAKHAFFMEKLLIETARVKASARLGWARLRYCLLPDPAAASPHAKIADVYEEASAQYDVRPPEGIDCLSGGPSAGGLP
jgi:hypothetical protein